MTPARTHGNLRRLMICLAAASALCLVGLAAPRRPPATSTQVLAAEGQPRLTHPDVACASCHQAIYASYEKTAMARGSGMALDGLIPGGFHHAASDVDYRVFLRDGQPWMSFSRPAAAGAGTPRGTLDGERKLEYFIGSGHRGRTFLYQLQGRWFELPINFYTRRNAWAMAPAYDNASSMPAELPVDPNCLHCHATGVSAALPAARNLYAGAPFAQGGIGCSACHGDPAPHLAQHGLGLIVNPAKLSPSRRDSACIQCHLEGDAVVYQPGRSLAQFQPGQELSALAVYFVRTQQPGGDTRATSQYEALLRSACKRASGDRMTCTTCHDPHSDPAPAERVAYFRARCLACHTSPTLATHHPEQQDCATCHMPTRKTSDISHEQVTDHNINLHIDLVSRPQDHAAIPQLAPGQKTELVPVGGFVADTRAQGLAYAQMAQRGDREAGETALRLLSAAAPGFPHDPELNVRLGYLQQISGDREQARASYTAALAADPYEPSALANLAVLDAGSGHVAEALSLLERLVSADPSRSSAGLNLAFIECKLGHAEDSLNLVRRLLVDNPDNQQLRVFQRTGSYGGQSCAIHPH